MTSIDPFVGAVASAAGAIFSAWTLRRAIKTGRTWYIHVSDMDRRTTPWNYRIALICWAVTTVAFIAACGHFIRRIARGDV